MTCHAFRGQKNTERTLWMDVGFVSHLPQAFQERHQLQAVIESHPSAVEGHHPQEIGDHRPGRIISRGDGSSFRTNTGRKSKKTLNIFVSEGDEGREGGCGGRVVAVDTNKYTVPCTTYHV